jgi:adenosine kinase
LGTDDIEQIAEKVAKWTKKNEKRTRIVVITRGDQSTIVYADDKLTMYPVMMLTADQLVDTNGAGDAFVGGNLITR